MNQSNEMVLPSKELLSEVVQYPVVDVKEINFNCVYYDVDSSYSRMYGEEIRDINMYELTHLMKEWLRGKGYIVTIYRHLDTTAISIAKEGCAGYISPSMSVTTEFEAVTKACEWILKEIK